MGFAICFIQMQSSNTTCRRNGTATTKPGIHYKIMSGPEAQKTTRKDRLACSSSVMCGCRHHKFKNNRLVRPENGRTIHKSTPIPTLLPILINLLSMRFFPRINQEVIGHGRGDNPQGNWINLTQISSQLRPQGRRLG